MLRPDARAVMRLSVALCAALAAASCGRQSPETYTLVRSSVASHDLRIHVATFDAKEGRGYNRSNCEIVAQLMRAQDGVVVEYWCEPGRFSRKG